MIGMRRILDNFFNVHDIEINDDLLMDEFEDIPHWSEELFRHFREWVTRIDNTVA